MGVSCLVPSSYDPSTARSDGVRQHQPMLRIASHPHYFSSPLKGKLEVGWESALSTHSTSPSSLPESHTVVSGQAPGCTPMMRVRAWLGRVRKLPVRGTPSCANDERSRLVGVVRKLPIWCTLATAPIYRCQRRMQAVRPRTRASGIASEIVVTV